MSTRHRIALACGVVASSIGLVALAGWFLGVPGLTTLLPGLASMKANTAASLAFLGASLALAMAARPAISAARFAAALVFVIALATILEYATGWELGLDEALVRDPATAVNPGRPSLATAVALGLAAAGMVTLDARRVSSNLSHVLGLLALTIAGVAALGYLYGVRELYSFGPFATMALHSAVALAVLATGIILAQPDRGAMGLAAGSTPGGLLIRQMLAATALVPIALGLLVLFGARAGWYTTEFAVALLVVGIVILLRAIVYRTAVQLDATETRRRVAAEEARRSAERERIVARTIADGIITIDAESRIEFVNRAAMQMFGYEARELVGQSLTVLMPAAFRARHLAAIERYTRTGEQTINWDGTELVGLRKGGEEFPIEVTFGEDRGGERRTFTGAIRDIGARKSLEAQLVRAQRLESVGRLAGGIAHDFNNILTAILGFAKLALDDPAEADPDRRKLRSIEDAAERGARLVSQLLAFSRQQVLRPERLDVVDVFDGIRGLLGRLIGEDIIISVRASADRYGIEADRGQLEQVLVNLAVNARDAMPHGGRLTLEAANVELDAAYAASHPEVPPGPYLMISVSDTGTGMDPVTQSRIFEPFFTTKEPGRGTGLGLSTVYGIVRQSGGHVSVYSEAGHGTTFRLYLPRAERPTAPPPPVPAPPGDLSGHETILVVEDEEVLRALIETVLRRLGYHVLLAADVQAALELTAHEPVDLLLTDVVMPGGSGLELADMLRQQRPSLPIVLMSGYSAAALERRRAPTDGPLLEKPFTPRELGRVVRAALDQTGRDPAPLAPAD